MKYQWFIIWQDGIVVICVLYQRNIRDGFFIWHKSDSILLQLKTKSVIFQMQAAKKLKKLEL